MTATKIKGLQQWCRRMTDGYDHVDIANFTTSFRDGMAFCALIHRFRPDLIDYELLSPENVYENCKLAFEVAEQELDIPAFLEAADMAKLKAPDKLSVITYVSQYYNVLSPLPQFGGPGVKCKVTYKNVLGSKRKTETDSSMAPTTKKAPVLEAKENVGKTTASVGDLCSICQNRVYLLERHTEGGKLYHRSCFRHSELSPTNKVYTRSPFLSPSLSSETPAFTYPSTSNSNIILPHFGKDSNQRTISGLEASESAKKPEGAGIKHLLNDIPKDSAKKSRPTSEVLFAEDKSKKASIIKDRLQSLKAKYSGNKSSNKESALPFSGKEARKLEKKREEILASRKPSDEPLKSTKENTPHILSQNNRLTTGSSVTGLVSARTAALAKSSAVSLSSKPSTATSTFSTSNPPAVDVSSSNTTTTSALSKLDSHVILSKDKYKDLKSKEKHSEETAEPNVLNKKTLSDASKHEKLSGKIHVDTKDAAKQAHPVARPRHGVSKAADKTPEDDTAAVKQVLKPSELTKKETTPTPAPRKNVLETPEKIPLDQPKLPQHKKHTEVDEKDTPRLIPTRKAPPIPVSAPPLPDSALPLPRSGPPPLPAATPVGEVNLQGDKVLRPSKKSISEETKSILNNKTQDLRGTSSTNTSHNLQHKDNVSKASFNDQKIINHKHKTNSTTESTLAYTDVKPQSTDETKADIEKLNTSSCDRRSSSPIPTIEHEKTLRNSPTESLKEEKVLTGLQRSLSVAKDQSFSPGSPDLTCPNDTSVSSLILSSELSSSKQSSEQPQLEQSPSEQLPSEPPQSQLSPAEPPQPVPSPEEPPQPVPSPEEPPQPVQSLEEPPQPVASPEELPQPVPSPGELPQPVALTEEPPQPMPSPEEPPKSVPSPKEPQQPVLSPEEPPQPVQLEPSLAHLETTKTNSTLSSQTCVNETSTSITLASDIPNSDPKNGSATSSPAGEIITSCVCLVSHELSELEISKNVNTGSDEPLGFSTLSVNVTYGNGDKLERSDSLNMKREDLEKEAEKYVSKCELEQSNIHPKPSRRNYKGETQSTPLTETGPLSLSKKDNSGFSLNHKDIYIPDKKELIKETDIVTKNENNNQDDNVEIAPQRPPRLSKMSKENSITEKNEHSSKVDENSVQRNQNKKQDLSLHNKDNKSVTSSVGGSETEIVVMAKADATQDFPQWKKDIEERKKKLREDIAKSESESAKLKYLREKGARKALKNSEFVDQNNDNFTNQNKSSDIESSLTQKLTFSALLGKESINDSDSQIIDRSFDSETKYNKHNAQQETENRKTLLPSSDVDQKTLKKMDKHERIMSNVPNNRSENLTQISDHSRVQLKKTANGEKTDSLSIDRVSLKHKSDKFKDTGVKFVADQEELKSKKGNIDSSLVEESELDKLTVDAVNDNEELLQQVSNAEVKLKTDIKAINEKSSLPSTNLMRDTKDLKTNINSSQTEHSSLSGKEHVSKLSAKESAIINTKDLVTISRVRSKDTKDEENNNSSDDNTSLVSSDTKQGLKLNTKEDSLLKTVSLDCSDESKDEKNISKSSHRISVVSQEKLVLQLGNRDISEDKDKQTSPKAKRRITVLGRNKEVEKSPPTSPLPMKKIEVSTKFNFEESSEFENSLTDSTAKLTIHDKQVPPQRPPPPRPHHNKVLPLQISAIELQQQLLDIDSQLTDLELRGRNLEESIRNENTLEDDDGAINEWFRLVCERNDLVRKEADLVYITRQQDLENEQEHIESQLHYLISKPEDCKSAEEKQEEVYLIKRKLELVEQRNIIVTSMDEDRIKYEIEDRDIKMRKEMGLWRNSTESTASMKERKVSKSVFYT